MARSRFPTGITTPSTERVAGVSWAGVAGPSRTGSVSSKMATATAVRTILGVSMA